MAVQLNAQRIALFRERYGEKALDLACHGAFPLTLTTDLLYCLREQFELGGDWYGAADVLLSGFCRSVGHDLYEMDGELRNALLHKLNARFPARLAELEEFMVGYIRHRLEAKQDWRALALGDPDPERMRWTVLACFRSEEVRAEIERALQEMAATEGNLKERLRLAALVESHASLLGEKEFKPILLDLAEKVADGEPVNERAAEVAALRQAGFGLKTLTFEYAEVVFGEEEEEVLPIESLGKFRFVTPTVDEDGNLLREEEGEASYFVEPLGDKGKAPFITMVAIPGGSFAIGKSAEEDGQPKHQVTLKPFFMGQDPVTQEQWRIVAKMPSVNRDLEAEPSRFKGNKLLPVERVSWDDAMEFCARLSQHSGRTYRLPTEAEWEYACRAGTTTAFTFGDSLKKIPPRKKPAVIHELQLTQLANFSYSKTTEVDLFPKNAFGLRDMHGNVLEWCADDWHRDVADIPKDGSAWLSEDGSTTKMLRGGSWNYFPRSCRSAYRYNFNRVDRNSFFGFRVMCEAPRTP